VIATPARILASCRHCGAAVEGAPFCCAACELAWEIVQGAGLERYYALREAPAPRPGPAGGGWNALPVEAEGDGRSAISLHIDGMRCAACAWVTERVLLATPGVVSASVGYATGRARIAWEPRTDLDTLCGRIAALGYRPRALGEAPAPDRELLLRLGVASFVAMNVMLASAAVYAGWFEGMSAGHAALFRWASLALATPVATWCASPFFVRAVAGLRAGVLPMDLPVAIGVATMYGHGLWATPRGEDAYLDSLSMLVALLLGGRVLEQRGRRRTTEAALSLAACAPRVVRRVEGGALVPAGSVAAGERIEVAAGEEIGADGVVEGGEGRVRAALLTGESEPVAVGVGDAVVAGSVLADGALRVRVEAAGGDTLLARMASELARAVERPAPPAVTDRIAPFFTGATLLLAGLGFATGGMATGVAVLVVACPCALALASPLAVAAGLGAAARRGLLIRSGGTLAALARARVVILDKTGTLTTGEPEVVSADDGVLRIAAGLARSSVHPVARAIVAAAVRRGIPLPEGRDVREEVGVGLQGVVDGRSWRLGAGAAGESLLTGGRLTGRIRLADAPRRDAAEAVAALRALGLRVVLLSGDHADVAGRIGELAGVDEVVAPASPAEKAAWIAAQGGGVVFVGDGLNDGPALLAADVGIAMGSGAASSVLAADAVVARDGLGPVVAGIRAARAAQRAVARNARRSIVYNALAVTAALAGVVNPLVAALLMPASSTLVIAGAARVERET
jgi:Cu2+-exporting ATPase